MSISTMRKSSMRRQRPRQKQKRQDEKRQSKQRSWRMETVWLRPPRRQHHSPLLGLDTLKPQSSRRCLRLTSTHFSRPTTSPSLTPTRHRLLSVLSLPSSTCPLPTRFKEALSRPFRRLHQSSPPHGLLCLQDETSSASQRLDLGRHLPLLCPASATSPPYSLARMEEPQVEYAR